MYVTKGIRIHMIMMRKLRIIHSWHKVQEKFAYVRTEKGRLKRRQISEEEPLIKEDFPQHFHSKGCVEVHNTCMCSFNYVILFHLVFDSFDFHVYIKTYYFHKTYTFLHGDEWMNEWIKRINSSKLTESTFINKFFELHVIVK